MKVRKETALIAMAVLELNDTGPFTGYGVYRRAGVSQAAAYRRLKQFEQNGWLKAKDENGARVYEVTSYGNTALRDLAFSYLRKCARVD